MKKIELKFYENNLFWNYMKIYERKLSLNI